MKGLKIGHQMSKKEFCCTRTFITKKICRNQNATEPHSYLCIATYTTNTGKHLRKFLRSIDYFLIARISPKYNQGPHIAIYSICVTLKPGKYMLEIQLFLLTEVLQLTFYNRTLNPFFASCYIFIKLENSLNFFKAIVYEEFLYNLFRLWIGLKLPSRSWAA